MSKVFFTGCLHFGHKNMAKWRGFQDSEGHDNLIISNWNKQVNKRDTVYILGDVTMENKNYYSKLKLLNGRKILVGGNHDLYKHSSEILEYVEGIAGAINYKGFMLTHIPVHPMEFEYRVKGNIHAHIHEKDVLKADNSIDHRYVHVGIGKNNFDLLEYGELRNLFSTLNFYNNKIF